MNLQSKPLRLSAAALALSALGFVAITEDESFVPVANVPTKGDRCTNGFGSTFKEDGTPVRCGEAITPVKALKRSLIHIAKDEGAIRQCVTAPISQVEYDLMVDFAYQYGSKALCSSSIVRYTNQGDYSTACGAYLRYRFAAGFDCSTPGNTRCAGVWTRTKERHSKCLKNLE